MRCIRPRITKTARGVLENDMRNDNGRVAELEGGQFNKKKQQSAAPVTTSGMTMGSRIEVRRSCLPLNFNL